MAVGLRGYTQGSIAITRAGHAQLVTAMGRA